MGLLDDAIREHLELKRRRGSDPSEIERAEREALGPVRREPEPIQPAADHEPDGVEDDLVDTFEDEAYESDYDGDVADDEFEGPYPESLGALPPEPGPPLPHGAVGPGSEPPLPHGAVGTGPEETPTAADPGPHEEGGVAPPPGGASPGVMPHESGEGDGLTAPRQDPLPEPSEPPAGRPSPQRDHLNQETAEHRIEQLPEEGATEDVLEETPEFLQDTPDHDRLWFEQRPPRDFDFDS